MENLEITNVFKFFEDNPKLTQDQWLVLGKGPSLDRVNKYNLTKYKIITLNDSITVCKDVILGHFIDLDAFERCSGEIALRKRYILLCHGIRMLIHDQVQKKLIDLIETNSILKDLAKEKRLLWYDLMTSEHRTGEFPTIKAVYFSAEAVFLISLRKVGIKYIKSIGIDGGVGYIAIFSMILRKTVISLINKNPSIINLVSLLI